MARFHRCLTILFVLLCVLAICVQCQQAQNKRRKGQGQFLGNGNGNGVANKQRRRPGQKQGQKPQQYLQQQQPFNQNKKPGRPNNKRKQGQNGNKNKVQNFGNRMRLITKQVPDLGRIRGRVFKTQWSGKEIMQFVDIPYGKSPSGALRFKPSVPVEPWDDELLHAYTPHWGCPTIQYLDRYEFIAEQTDVDLEDCLRLSVSSKSLTGSAPVMVYIHGDFLYDGNSNEAAPGYLLEEDVVLVSVRYRLGPFGFLSTLTDDMPGNAAVTDVILALQWIQKHIGAFGGDPSRVTLFGQVGGAALIHVLTMSPAVTDNLFHRVIYQSGSAMSPAFITDNPMKATKDIARIAGCKNVNKPETIAKCLRRMNATTILQAFNEHGDSKATLGVGSYGGVQFVIGGPSNILPEHPGKLLAGDKFKAYPTMGGSVKNAGTFILKDIFIDNFNETIIDDKLNGPGYVKHVITETNGADPTGAWMKFAQEEVFQSGELKNGSFYKMVPGLIDMCSTIPFKNPVLLALQANSKVLPNDTFLYTFDYQGEINRYATNEDEDGAMPFELGVSLTDDNLYLFPWPQDSLLNSNRDIKIAKRMVALWTSFATNGVPKAPNVPEWPPMTDEAGPYMKIDKTVRIADNYLDEYVVAVKEAQLGYDLVNDEFFDSLVEITTDNGKDSDNDDDDADAPATGHKGQKGDKHDDEDDEEEAENEEDEEEEEEDEDNDNDEDGDDNNEHHKGRGQPIVYIANKTKRIF